MDRRKVLCYPFQGCSERGVGGAWEFSLKATQKTKWKKIVLKIGNMPVSIAGGWIDGRERGREGERLIALKWPALNSWHRRGFTALWQRKNNKKPIFLPLKGYKMLKSQMTSTFLCPTPNPIHTPAGGHNEVLKFWPA